MLSKNCRTPAMLKVGRTEFPGDGCLGLSLVPERLRKPVYPGDRIDVEIEITKLRGPLVEFDVTMKDLRG